VLLPTCTACTAAGQPGPSGQSSLSNFTAAEKKADSAYTKLRFRDKPSKVMIHLQSHTRSQATFRDDWSTPEVSCTERVLDQPERSMRSRGIV
jgi:hypothetical protein